MSMHDMVRRLLVQDHAEGGACFRTPLAMAAVTVGSALYGACAADGRCKRTAERSGSRSVVSLVCWRELTGDEDAATHHESFVVRVRGRADGEEMEALHRAVRLRQRRADVRDDQEVSVALGAAIAVVQSRSSARAW